jgi:WD40 repeat protein
VNDSQHFLLEHYDTICNSPSHIYHSALLLCPSSSWLHNYYAAELSGVVKVVKGLTNGWGTCSRTVALNGAPLALACWEDTIAVGLESGEIIILNAVAGSQVAVLSGHTDWVRSLAFSLDGTLLVSGSHEKALKLWDIQTGGAIKTFYGHTGWVHSVSISADCTMITSGSVDQTICLWNIQTGEHYHTIEQQGDVHHVIFSPKNPQHIISASDSAVQVWDIDGHQVRPPHKGPHHALSSNGTYSISCSKDGVTVQNLDSGAIVANCPIPSSDHDPDFNRSCFSPDSRLIAVASGYTVYVWDITGSGPLLIETFIGHSSTITSLAFSSPSTLISASLDQSIKFWQIGGLSTNLVVGDPKFTPPTSVPIQSVSLQVGNGITITSDLGGVVRTWDISTGLCKASFQTPAKDRYLRDAQMKDGRLIFAWLRKGGISIWDTKKGEPQMVDINWGLSGGLRISGDGSKVFLETNGVIQARSIQTGEAVGRVRVGDNSYLDCYLDPLCVDGSRIWANFKNKPTQGWDFGVSGSSPVPLSNTSSERPHLYFIHGIRAWGNGPSRIEDTVTNKVVFQLSGRYTNPADVRWDGQYLVAGYESGEVLILDFNLLS